LQGQTGEENKDPKRDTNTEVISLFVYHRILAYLRPLCNASTRADRCLTGIFLLVTLWSGIGTGKRTEQEEEQQEE
jgi:hypothetical protein